ncbi:lysozyme inhibitor LprI family protein [Azospirillum sp. TSO35-2]|uniref:lysozyme inhibitor LprI family protein n=1 Tax=Azospirillum sp. TSO35-2 TaxID=716796 RepID=UPI000D65AD17|nr:lysozyme inhibitor LprI family protein [Azospirillum sp. TSO35-2]
MRFLILAAALSVVGGGSGFAASFDCGKASTPVEKAICADQRLSDLDSELGRAYKAALQSNAAPADLKAEQKSWVVQRNRCTDTACLASAYQARLAALSAPPQSSTAGVAVMGTYQTKGGELLVAQPSADAIKFRLNATYRMNTGEVEGMAVLSNNQAIFAPPGGSEYDDCRITLTFLGETAKVNQEGSCGMGLNVSGSGSYKRSSKTTPVFN